MSASSSGSNLPSFASSRFLVSPIIASIYICPWPGRVRAESQPTAPLCPELNRAGALLWLLRHLEAHLVRAVMPSSVYLEAISWDTKTLSGQRHGGSDR